MLRASSSSSRRNRASCPRPARLPRPFRPRPALPPSASGAAWTLTIGSPAIVVADLDTGVRFDHPDNRAIAAGGNLLPGYDMVSDVATANDGDGRDADPSDPGDWVTQAELDNKSGPFYHCT